jgi:hypothetical protein
LWLFELKGAAIIFKTALLGLALAVPWIRSLCFIAIILISGLIAHAPARWRARRWIDLPIINERQT